MRYRAWTSGFSWENRISDPASIFQSLSPRLRSAYYLATGKNPDADAFKAVRGEKPWKEAAFNIPGAGDIRVAVVSGLGNTLKLMA